jgi:hypothetical protein
MTRRKPAEDVGHVELVLAGDFKSPTEVLAADVLTDAQKKEVLMVWRRDLMRSGGRQEHEELLASIDEAIERLDPGDAAS